MNKYIIFAVVILSVINIIVQISLNVKWRRQEKKAKEFKDKWRN